MDFLALQDFIQNKMRMSHIYQPVMLITLLEHGGPFLADSISGFPAFAENDGKTGALALHLGHSRPLTFVTLAVKAGVHA